MRELWFVYILRCADGTYYRGIAKNVDARVAKHNSGRGAAYTRARRPVEVVYRERKFSRVTALLREIAIKRLARDRKTRLIRRGRPCPPGPKRRVPPKDPWDIIFKRKRHGGMNDHDN